MNISILSPLHIDEGGSITFTVVVSDGDKTQLIPMDITADLLDYDAATSPPREVWGPRANLPPDGVWVYRRYALMVKDSGAVDRAELSTRIKHAVMREERHVGRIAREVEAFEALKLVPESSRESIPRLVRIFVWQRDGGKCVQCGARERLEFDHVIPVALGGATTPRNIQLLCEDCNRAKGASI